MEKECVVSVHVVQKVYRGKKIQVKFFDGFYCGQRITKLSCSKYFKDVITLNNPTDEQIANEVNNLFKIVAEIIDNNSIVNKVKKIFR